MRDSAAPLSKAQHQDEHRYKIPSKAIAPAPTILTGEYV
jgi:hypothetical protein